MLGQGGKATSGRGEGKKERKMMSMSKVEPPRTVKQKSHWSKTGTIPEEEGQKRNYSDDNRQRM